ncbi:MAG: hypothetical protein ACOC9Z_02320 [Chloroflexota bacterium]
MLTERHRLLFAALFLSTGAGESYAAHLRFLSEQSGLAFMTEERKRALQEAGLVPAVWPLDRQF